MAQSGPKWPRVAQRGPEWPQWSKWPRVAQSGPEWAKCLLENSETNFFLGHPEFLSFGQFPSHLWPVFLLMLVSTDPLPPSPWNYPSVHIIRQSLAVLTIYSEPSAYCTYTGQTSKVIRNHSVRMMLVESENGQMIFEKLNEQCSLNILSMKVKVVNWCLKK